MKSIRKNAFFVTKNVTCYTYFESAIQIISLMIFYVV